MAAMIRPFAVLLCVVVTTLCFAGEPGPDYKLVDQTKPDPDLEFFGGPHIDIVKEVYRRTDERSPIFKIVLSSLAKPSRKELLFAYDRAAEADLSPDGKWFVINDRPDRGQCEPRLFKQQTGLKFTEVREANIQQKAIDFFIRYNKFPESIRKHLIGESDCFVESTLWSDDSSSLLLRISKGQTGEPIWIYDWRCIYDLKTGECSTDLKILNRGSILPGKYLVPSR
jgi:hypothetical protein